MLEVPSLLYQLDELLVVWIFSRSVPTISCSFFTPPTAEFARRRPFDAISAPVLRALKAIADHGEPAKPVTLCGTRLDADRSAGAGRDRLSLALALSVRRGAGQGHVARSQCPQGRGPDPAPDRQSGRQHADPRTPQGICSRGRAAALMRNPCKPDGARPQGHGTMTSVR